MPEVTVARPFVEEAVRAAFGPRTQVTRHKTRTLTAPGDNFATTVVCLQVDLETSPDTSPDGPGSRIQGSSENGVSQDTGSENRDQLDVDSTSCSKKGPSTAKERKNVPSTKDSITQSESGTDSSDGHCAGNTSTTKQWTCIAKMNSKKESVFFQIFSRFAFDNEIKFYTVLLPALNKELSKSKIPQLKVSEYYYSHKEKDNELLIMEDLRRSGFTMGNKTKGLDSNHCIAVVKEIAKLHSASVLVTRNRAKEVEMASRDTPAVKLETCANERHCGGSDDTPVHQHDNGTRCGAVDFISAESYLVKDGPILNIFVGLAQNRITNALGFLSKRQNTEQAVAWLESIQADVPAFLRRMLVKCDPEFRVLCHGDTWTNNFLFSPSLDAVSMVDFQIIKAASLATDLNYLLYTSHIGYFTPTNIDLILDAYYAEFEVILATQGYQMPFTREALTAEVEAKKPWGIMGGVVTLPMLFPRQEEDESKTFPKEMDQNSKKDEDERNKIDDAQEGIRPDPKEQGVNHHSESGVRQASKSVNMKTTSAGKQAEVPCNYTYEQKFLHLFKNITQ